MNQADGYRTEIAELNHELHLLFLESAASPRLFDMAQDLALAPFEPRTRPSPADADSDGWEPETRTRPAAARQGKRMAANRYASWNQLIGAAVDIRQSGDHITTGTVDTAMPDSSALWIAPDGNNPGIVYEASLGYQTWVQPQELTGTSCHRMTAGMLYAQG